LRQLRGHEAALSASTWSSDLREGGRWGVLQTCKNAALYVIIRACVAVTSRVPLPVLRVLGIALGRLGFVAWSSGRKTALTNLARVFPACPPAEREAMARRTYENLGEHLADAVASLAPESPVMSLPFPEHEQRVLREAVEEGRGVLFVSAHLGPWERVARTLVASGFALTTVARESYDPRLTSLYDRLRGSRGVRSIYRGARGSGLRMLRTLRDGGMLGVPMDLRSRVPSIEVPFLGTPAPTARGPAQLALAARAAVVVGSVASDPASGALSLTMTRLELSAPDVVTLTAAINDELSRRILALPEHWLWMHPRW
jgi:KDO2-lipid IV(A) lauroyltransferase